MATKTNPALQGLQQSLQPDVDDPLGTNRKRRGLDAYYEEARKSNPFYASGPLPDPQWAGFFQAMADQGVTKVGMDAERPHGIAEDPEWALQGDVGARSDMSLPHQPLMRSTNIAGPSAALANLSQKKKLVGAR